MVLELELECTRRKKKYKYYWKLKRQFKILKIILKLT